jgi:hypothetical protein
MQAIHGSPVPLILLKGFSTAETIRAAETGTVTQ